MKMSTMKSGAAALFVVAGSLWLAPGSAEAAAQRPDRREMTLPFVERGAAIGIRVRDLTEAELRKGTLKGGAVVEAVEEGSPASKAGLHAGDIVTEFDGERVRSARQLSRLVADTPPGRTVTATVSRDGAARRLDVTPEGMDARVAPGIVLPELSDRLRRLPRDLQEFDFDYRSDPPTLTLERRTQLGVRVQPVGAQLAAYFGVTDGLLVASVDRNSPAEKAGITAGDVITAVNGRAVHATSELARALQEAGSGATVELSVTRDKKSISIKATLPEDLSRRPSRRLRTV